MCSYFKLQKAYKKIIKTCFVKRSAVFSDTHHLPDTFILLMMPGTQVFYPNHSDINNLVKHLIDIKGNWPFLLTKQMHVPSLSNQGGGRVLCGMSCLVVSFKLSSEDELDITVYILFLFLLSNTLLIKQYKRQFMHYRFYKQCKHTDS